MLPYRDSRLTKIVLVIFFIVIAAYAYYEGRGLLFGPKINVPETVQTVSEPYVRIKGKADRISALALNGKPIQVTAEGAFDEPYLLAEGLNRILLDATDKYGRTRQEVIQIVYAPTSTPTTVNATSSIEISPATSTATTTQN